jgi:hypothetical protein
MSKLGRIMALLIFLSLAFPRLRIPRIHALKCGDIIAGRSSARQAAIDRNRLIAGSSSRRSGNHCPQESTRRPGIRAGGVSLFNQAKLRSLPRSVNVTDR